MFKLIKICIAFCLSIPLLANSQTSVEQPKIENQKNQTQETINVGYYITDYFSMKHSDGTYYGYAYDYLAEINSITRWDINFKESSFSDLITRLLDPNDTSVQLMLGISNSVEKYNSLCFTSSPLTTTQYELYASNSSSIQYNDYNSMMGMKCGVMRGNMQIKQLEKYNEEHGAGLDIDASYISTQAMIEALDKGDLDLIYATDIPDRQYYKVVSVFNEIGLYIAAKNGMEDTINEIEQAMYEIKSINPLFTSQLAEKYYKLTNVSVPSFTEEEKEYIKQLNSANSKIKIGTDPKWKPLEYFQNHEYKGIFSEIYKKISEISDLQFEFVETEDYVETLDLIKNNEIDILSAITKDYSYVYGKNVYLSTPLFSSKISIIAHDSKINLSTGKIIMPKDYYLADYAIEKYGADQVTTLQTYEMCLDYVKNNSNSYTVAVSALANYYKTNYLYENLFVSDSSIQTTDLAIGVSKSTDPLLLSILNKSIQMVSSDEIELIIASNSVCHNEGVQYFFYSNRSLIATVSIIILLISIVILITILTLRNKSNNLIKAQKQRLSIAMNYVSSDIYEFNKLTKKLHLLSNHHINFIPSDTELSSTDMAKAIANINYEDIAKQIDNLQNNDQIDLPISNLEDTWVKIETRDLDTTSNMMILVFTDVTQEHKMRNEATKDFLTGLYNRRSIVNYFNENKDKKCLVLFDIDNFKKVNDTLGHAVGDELLIAVSKILSDNFDKDFVGRFGGDEFVAITSSYTSAKTLAKLSINQVDEYAKKKGQSFSLSCGICQLNKDTTFDEGYKNSDLALYTSKLNGKGRLEIYSPSLK